MAYKILKKVEVNNTKHKDLDLLRYAILEKDNQLYLQLKIKNKSKYTITSFTIHYFDGNEQKEYLVENLNIAPGLEFFDKHLIKVNTSEFGFLIFSNVLGKSGEIESELIINQELEEQTFSVKEDLTIHDKVNVVRIEKPKQEVKKENKKIINTHALKLLAVALFIITFYPTLDVIAINGSDIFDYGTIGTIILYIINIIGFISSIVLFIFALVKEIKNKQDTQYRWKHVVHFIFVCSLIIIVSLIVVSSNNFGIIDYYNSTSGQNGSFPVPPLISVSNSNSSTPSISQEIPSAPKGEGEYITEAWVGNFLFNFYTDNTAEVISFLTEDLYPVIPSEVEMDGAYYTVTSIAEDAFNYLVLYEITLPSSLEVISDGAFENCADLSKVIIESDSNLKYIGNRAFKNTSITEIDLMFADKLEYIGEEAFRSADLSYIYIGENVKYIGPRCFVDCIGISFEVSSLNTRYENRANSLYSKEKNSLICYSNGDLNVDGYAVVDSVDEIEEYAFAYNTSIKILKIYDAKKIGYGAFYNCVGLDELYIDDTVREMFTVFIYHINAHVYFKASGANLPYGWSGVKIYCAGHSTGVNF